MKFNTIHINWFAIVQIAVSLILGFSGLVSWWVIGFIWIMEFEIETTHRI